MNIDLHPIPLPIRKAAWQIISNQKSVPLSPLADNQDGELELCAAAALAVAAVDNDADRADLIHRFRKGGRESLVASFEELGWTRQLCSKVLALNDAIEPSKRKSEILVALQT